MSSFELAAVLGIVNHRCFHLPRTIALMAGSLVLLRHSICATRI
jgi:hypothetical protein